MHIVNMLMLEKSIWSGKRVGEGRKFMINP
jgi:hypothetical protein